MFACWVRIVQTVYCPIPHLETPNVKEITANHIVRDHRCDDPNASGSSGSGVQRYQTDTVVSDCCGLSQSQSAPRRSDDGVDAARVAFGVR